MKLPIALCCAALLLASCATAPRPAPEFYGADLDAVEAAVSAKYETVYETSFRENPGRFILALGGSLATADGRTVITGGGDPHSLIQKTGALRPGSAAYLRFKPLTAKWFSLSVENGDWGKPGYASVSLISTETMQVQPYQFSGSGVSPKPWTSRQFNFKQGEYLALFEIGFDNDCSVKIFNEKGQYNSYRTKLKPVAGDWNFYFKLERGTAELAKYKELES